MDHAIICRQSRAMSIWRIHKEKKEKRKLVTSHNHCFYIHGIHTRTYYLLGANNGVRLSNNANYINWHQDNVVYSFITGQNLKDWRDFTCNQSLFMAAEATFWRPYLKIFGEWKYSALGNLIALLHRYWASHTFSFQLCSSQLVSNLIHWRRSLLFQFHLCQILSWSQDIKMWLYMHFLDIFVELYYSVALSFNEFNILLLKPMIIWIRISVRP